MTAAWAAIATSIITLIGTILTVYSGNKKTMALLDKQQAITDTKLSELTREVREHNEFARRMPVGEEKVAQLEGRIRDVQQ